MAVVRLICQSFAIGPFARISGVQGGPTTTPPVAVTALMITPVIVAAPCQVDQAEQMVEHILPM
jgi:hypothetical protein